MNKKFLEETDDKSTAPRKTEAVLEAILTRFVKRTGSIPMAFRQRGVDSIQAVVPFWMKNQSLPMDNEKPRRALMSAKQHKTRWIEPYTDRLAYNLSLFLSMTLDDQNYILAAAEDRRFWNGDYIDDTNPLKFFRSVVTETFVMPEIGVDAYRQQALSKMKAFLAKAQTT